MDSVSALNKTHLGTPSSHIPLFSHPSHPSSRTGSRSEEAEAQETPRGQREEKRVGTACLSHREHAWAPLLTLLLRYKSQ